PILHDAQLGDSISVNGVCLTITSLLPHPPTAHDSPHFTSFTVNLAPETLRLTTFGLSTIIAGTHVNLERALTNATRFGGHYVQGHVDTIARIVRKTRDEESVRFEFFIPKSVPGGDGVGRYIVQKGFVAVDGASLTVTGTGRVGVPGEEGDEGCWFEVMLVAYTQEKIVTAGKEVGEWVNVEVDMVGKVIEKQIQEHISGPAFESLVEKIVTKKLIAAGVLTE
ncbi:hypothetical protein DFH27DRAFT_484509, partial [Peziza echinospora]